MIIDADTGEELTEIPKPITIEDIQKIYSDKTPIMIINNAAGRFIQIEDESSTKLSQLKAKLGLI